MAHGALRFESHLSRWIDTSTAIRISTPFVYGVHVDSMLSPAQVEQHFAACCRIFGEVQQATGQSYLGSREPIGFRRLSDAETADIVDPASFVAAYQTTELSVDPRHIGEHLGAALLTAPRTTVSFSVTVTGVTRRSDGKYMVHYTDGQAQSAGPYDHVVNATWSDRLAIDQASGKPRPDRPWSFRHKFGSRVKLKLAPGDLPSITAVLGPFGDLVNLGDNGLFLSWYPTGMVAMTGELAPPADWRDLTREERLRVFHESRRQWETLCPGLGRLEFEDESVDPVSGVIFAWGDTDIDDAESGLHSRFAVGVTSEDGYHSVNTGKYTLVPYMADRVARRVLGQPQDNEASGALLFA